MHGLVVALRRGAAVVTLAAASVGCGDDVVRVRLQVPPGLGLEGLGLTATVYAPADIACDDIAFGLVDDAALARREIARTPLAGADGTLATVAAGVDVVVVVHARRHEGAADGALRAAGCALVPAAATDVALALEAAAAVFVDAAADARGPGRVRGGVRDREGALLGGARVRAALRAVGAPTVTTELVTDDAGAFAWTPTPAPAGPWRIDLRARWSDDVVETLAGLALPDATPLPMALPPPRADPGGGAGGGAAPGAAVGPVPLVVDGALVAFAAVDPDTGTLVVAGPDGALRSRTPAQSSFRAIVGVVAEGAQPFVVAVDGDAVAFVAVDAADGGALAVDRVVVDIALDADAVFVPVGPCPGQQRLPLLLHRGGVGRVLDRREARGIGLEAVAPQASRCMDHDQRSTRVLVLRDGGVVLQDVGSGFATLPHVGALLGLPRAVVVDAVDLAEATAPSGPAWAVRPTGTASDIVGVVGVGEGFTLAAPAALASVPGLPRQVAVAALHGAGDAVVALYDEDVAGGQERGVVIAGVDGDGALLAGFARLPGCGAGCTVVVADVNGDGAADLAQLDADGVGVRRFRP
jgi:hypothetical protein